ncbi:MAG TPA: hypothetical protein PLT04_01595 [Candidatus Saccharibacteria bacterium]|nr:hypothetical protein [Candidatus Saccharibacteria bacterium]
MKHQPESSASKSSVEQPKETVWPLVLGGITLVEFVEGASEVIMHGELSDGAFSLSVAALAGVGTIVASRRK